MSTETTESKVASTILETPETVKEYKIQAPTAATLIALSKLSSTLEIPKNYGADGDINPMDASQFAGDADVLCEAAAHLILGSREALNPDKVRALADELAHESLATVSEIVVKGIANADTAFFLRSLILLRKTNLTEPTK